MLVLILVHFCQQRSASLQHSYSTITARHVVLDASAYSPRSSVRVRVACYLYGVLRAPCLVPRHAAATWNRLPPRLDVASDAMQHYSVGLAFVQYLLCTSRTRHRAITPYTQMFTRAICVVAVRRFLS
ncbi:hypothetical protein HDV63DRAFT_366707 [Trichoderma sp. SZMC 28014]